MLTALLLGACTMRDTALSPQDSEKVTVRFGVDVPNFTTSRTVGIDENKIETLELWVFDKDGHFLERAKAENIKSTDNKTYTYEAKMTPAPDGCIIHFVANKSLGDDAKALTLTGKNESDVLFSIDGTSDGNVMTMWGRKKYDQEIKKDSHLGTIEVLRNMAKFRLVITGEATSKLTDVTYALYRTYDKGSIAPFDPDKKEFTEGAVTEPAGASLINYDKDGQWLKADAGQYHYGYERKNADAKEISCLIVKGTYKGEGMLSPEECYYKIDFVNTDKVRYDILRNHFYKVTINDVRAKGYKSREEALKGLAANNLALSEEIQSFPTFSDGAGTLVVKGDKTFFAFVDNREEFSFDVDYLKNNNPNNANITLKASGDAIIGTPTNNNGKITVKLNKIPANNGSLTSELIIGVKDNPELKRLVRIQVRPQFDLTVTPEYTTINKTQDTPLTLTLKIPEEFRKELLPITFRFYTENFYPSGNQGFSYGRKGDKTFYEVIVTSISDNRQLTYNFKSNKSNSAETIKVECVEGYFKEKNVQITNRYR
ncbi:Major fimbrium tip subunit FimE [Porphyromonas levii]|nr:Major fimbrium tip subunit FimE [Porphyromonas levii]